MRPLIPAGSRLLVEFGGRPQRVGDVILFRRDERLVAHRVVALRAEGPVSLVVPKGDGETYLDPAIDAADVLGVIRDVVRPDGTRALGAIAPRSGSLIGRVSWWSGRAAGFATRSVRRSTLPRSIRRVALRAFLALSRVPTRVTLAIMPRLDRGDPAGKEVNANVLRAP